MDYIVRHVSWCTAASRFPSLAPRHVFSYSVTRHVFSYSVTRHVFSYSVNTISSLQCFIDVFFRSSYGFPRLSLKIHGSLISATHFTLISSRPRCHPEQTLFQSLLSLFFFLVLGLGARDKGIVRRECLWPSLPFVPSLPNSVVGLFYLKYPGIHLSFIIVRLYAYLRLFSEIKRFNAVNVEINRLIETNTMRVY